MLRGRGRGFGPKEVAVHTREVIVIEKLE